MQFLIKTILQFDLKKKYEQTLIICFLRRFAMIYTDKRHRCAKIAREIVFFCLIDCK